VHDPNNSLRTGDVVAITPGWRTSKAKRHVVKHIIAPAQVPIDEREPVPTEEERWAQTLARYNAKVARKAATKAARRPSPPSVEDAASHDAGGGLGDQSGQSL